MEHEALCQIIDALVSTGITEFEAVSLVCRLLEEEAEKATEIMNENSQLLS